MALRPNLEVTQVFRPTSPVTPDASNPVVLVGVQRQLEYRKSAGVYTGGLDNGDYSFPDLITGSAVENASIADTVLRPKVYISNEFGVAEITSDATFADLENVSAVPSFTLSSTADATFEVSAGLTGAFESTSGGDAGTFTDVNADFIEDLAAVGDLIKVGGRTGFTVTAVTSDDELGVTRSNSGPIDALVQLSAKDANDVRTLSYIGSSYAGFSTSGVARGDLVNFNGWSPRTSTDGLTYTAADATTGIRTLTATGLLTSVAAGNLIVTVDGNNEEVPSFIVIDATLAPNSVTAVDVIGSEIPASEDSVVLGLPSKNFNVRVLGAAKTDGSNTRLTDGFYGAQTSGVRVFTDAAADFTNVGFAAADLILVHAARTDDAISITSLDATSTFTRSTGSFLDDGFAVNMSVFEETSANAGAYTITAVTALVMTVSESISADETGSDYVFTSASVSIPFVVLAAETDLSNVNVSDFGDSLRLDTEVGGALQYAVKAAAISSTAGSGVASVTAEVGGIRDVEWPVAFLAGTLPVAGDYVFNDDGVLLFNVIDAVFDLAITSTTFATPANTITFVGGTADLTTIFTNGDVIHIPEATDAANMGLLTVTGVAGAVLTVSNALAAEVGGANFTVQKFEVEDHSTPGFDVPTADPINKAGLDVRKPDAAPYSVIRVLDDTTLQLTHVLAGDEVTDAIVRGLDTKVTLPNSVSNLDYTIEKTLTGSALTGTVLATYAGRRRDHLGEIQEVEQGTVSTFGPLVPGNPLGYAALNAVNNTSVVVKMIQVGDDTRAGWTAALDTATTPDVYIMIPLTQDETILGDYRNHVLAQSSPDNKRERIMWQSHVTDPITVRFTGTSSDTAVLVVTSSAQTVTITTTSDLTGLGVIAGDYIEGDFAGYFTNDGFDTGTYRARITSVTDNGGSFTFTMLPVTINTTVAAGVLLSPVRVESKSLTYTQLRDAIAAYPGTLKDRRLRNIYPSSELVTFDDDTNAADVSTGFYGGGVVTDHTVGGWLQCARTGALRSGLNPATPLTKRLMSGTQRLVTQFSTDVAAQDAILDGGNYLVVQPNGENAGVFAVRAVTTDVSDVFFLEEQVTVQVDNFARLLRQQITPILGSTVLDESFFDLYSMTQAGVIKTVIDAKSLKSAKLLEIREDPDRPDTFLASYNVGVFVSAANGDITIFI